MFAAAVALSLLASSPKVHLHAAGEAGFVANAYLVESDQGVVAVDAPFTVSEARAFRKELDALHKPLLGVLVTHAHPDHVNGITELLGGRDVPIYALEGVSRTLQQIDGPKRAYWAPIYKAEYPAKTTFPNHLVHGGDRVTLGGMTFAALDLGQGESADETIWVLQDENEVAFVGDLVMSHLHSWVAEGHTADWLKALATAQRALKGVQRIYPGHGRSGGLELLGWERDYLRSYREAVRQLAHGRNALTDAQKKALEKRMAHLVPDGRLAVLVGMGADPVAAELAAHRSALGTR